MKTLEEILAAVLAARAPSREIDNAIALVALEWEQRALGGAGMVFYAPGNPHPIPVSPRFTENLGDAMDFAREQFPTLGIGVRGNNSIYGEDHEEFAGLEPWEAEIVMGDGDFNAFHTDEEDDVEFITETANGPALAVVAATLAALIRSPAFEAEHAAANPEEDAPALPESQE